MGGLLGLLRRTWVWNLVIIRCTSARSTWLFFFNGRIYSLIVRGAQTPLSRIEAASLYIKQKMRMP